MVLRHFILGLRKEEKDECDLRLKLKMANNFDELVTVAMAVESRERKVTGVGGGKSYDRPREFNERPKEPKPKKVCKVHGLCGHDDSQCKMQDSKKPNPAGGDGDSGKSNGRFNGKAKDERDSDLKCFHCMGPHKKFRCPHAALQQDEARRAMAQSTDKKSVRVRRFRVAAQPGYEYHAFHGYVTPMDHDFGVDPTERMVLRSVHVDSDSDPDPDMPPMHDLSSSENDSESNS